jgi:hypothetical protein
VRAVIFNVQLFRSQSDRVVSEKTLEILLVALTAANAAYLQAHPSTPRLYDAGVRYVPEDYPREEWQGIEALYRAGEGDCEDLACARCAELIVFDGIAARPVFRSRELRRPDGSPFRLYHILVQYPDGRIEDPSAILGMGSNPWELRSHSSAV